MALKRHPVKPKIKYVARPKLKAEPPVPTPQKGPMLDPQVGQLIAITGGIGTGKTFVLECLEELGFVVFSADKAVHDMLRQGGAAYEEVGALFPQSLVDGVIDRKIISDIVFKDSVKLKQLEAILHPKLREAQVDLAESVKKEHGKSVVFEVPLLFENQREGHYDFVIVTTLSKTKQKERVLKRKNMTEEKFDAIIEQQVTDAERVHGAHFIINTGKGKEDTIRQVKAIVRDERPKRDSTRHRNHRPICKKR